jgi:hypothetical protein
MADVMHKAGDAYHYKIPGLVPGFIIVVLCDHVLFI